MQNTKRNGPKFYALLCVFLLHETSVAMNKQQAAVVHYHSTNQKQETIIEMQSPTVQQHEALKQELEYHQRNEREIQSKRRRKCCGICASLIIFISGIVACASIVNIIVRDIQRQAAK